jgi:hypothetical protein
VLVQTKNAPILQLLKQFGKDATIALGLVIMQMFMLLVMLILQQIPAHVVLEV